MVVWALIGNSKSCSPFKAQTRPNQGPTNPFRTVDVNRLKSDQKEDVFDMEKAKGF